MHKTRVSSPTIPHTGVYRQIVDTTQHKTFNFINISSTLPNFSNSFSNFKRKRRTAGQRQRFIRPSAQNAKGSEEYLQKKINKFSPENFMLLGKTTRGQMGSKFKFRPDKA